MQDEGTTDLVERVRSGDEAAWSEMVEQYQAWLHRLARQYRLSSADAADAVQLTWLRCLEHLQQLSSVEALGAWLGTICRRESMRLASRLSREQLLAEVDDHFWRPSADRTGDPCEDVARRDEHDRLYAAIAALPPRPRAVLEALLAPESNGYADVSRRLGVPVGSLGPTRRRAMERLRADPRLADAMIG